MKRCLLLVLASLGLSLSAVAAPGQEPRQSTPHQATRKADYWLSQDMQRLVFWQSREPEMQTGRSSSR